MAKSRLHTVLVTLSFDAPVTPAAALAAAKNNIHGKFYATLEEEDRDGWETGRIKSVKRHPRKESSPC